MFMPDTTILKVEDLYKLVEDQRTVYNWGLTSFRKNDAGVMVEYEDRQGHVISDEEIEKACVKLMSKSYRPVRLDHTDLDIGRVDAAWPVTKQFADATGTEWDRFGLLYLIKIEEWCWSIVKESLTDNSISRFSIGGNGMLQEIE